MSDATSTRVSIGLINTLERVAEINRTERNVRSERGFATTMRVASDRPSKLVRLADGSMPGMSVGWQRVHADALTYKQRVAKATPLRQREVKPESVWKDIGSTFEAKKFRSRTPDIRHLSIREALFV